MVMKANVPEKIYIHKSQYWGLMANDENITKNGIEYIRTDAFIEKACEFLAENMKCDGYTLQTKAKFISDFREYIKGEE
jgi:hypothetical protein